MSVDEIVRIAKIAVSLGISRIKLTGGEPLMLKNLCEVVKGIASIPGLKDLSMTTNGTMLGSMAEKLSACGLRRLNISLPTLNTEIYTKLTEGKLENALDGVRAAVAAGFHPVKLNMVVLKGVNAHHIEPGIECASCLGAILQLIEFETNREEAKKSMFKRYHYRLGKVEETLARRAIDTKERHMHRRKKYILPSENNGRAEVEIVRGMHNSLFCENCTRLRITSSGELKPCLLRSDNHIEIIDPIREGASDDELIALFEKAIYKKEPYWRA